MSSIISTEILPESLAPASTSPELRHSSPTIPTPPATPIIPASTVRKSMGRRESLSAKKALQDGIISGLLNDCDDGLALIKSPGKGRGLVATKSFTKGQFVVEYAGELVSKKEGEEREKNYEAEGKAEGFSYFFTFDGKKYWYV